MNTSLPGCATDCPHRERPSNACGHDLGQALRAEFAQHPEMDCPFAERP
ncbi:MAG: hypothetical protein ABEJ30_04560 [Halorientalis sp.]